MKNFVVLVFATGAFVTALQLFAQEPAGPPPVLEVFREDIKEGKGAAHEKSEAAFMQMAAKVKLPAHVLGMTAVTGTSQAWFLEGHASFASIAESQAAMNKPEFAALDAVDAELRSGSRSMIAVYRPEMSYAADKINLPKVRFFSIETVRVKPGQDGGLAGLAKLLIAAAEKSSSPQPVVLYQVVSGAPNGTYLVMELHESLKSMDDAPAQEKAQFQALGDEGMARVSKLVTDTIANEETTLFAVSPKMSYVPKEWITADPEFWAPKPVKSTKAPAKPGEKTTAAK
jgi:hypothetical protein